MLTTDFKTAQPETAIPNHIKFAFKAVAIAGQFPYPDFLEN